MSQYEFLYIILFDVHSVYWICRFICLTKFQKFLAIFLGGLLFNPTYFFLYFHINISYFVKLLGLMQILAHRIHCGSSIQIHTDYRNPVEEKGWRGHSLKRRAPLSALATPSRGECPDPCLVQAFIVFLGPLHQRRSSFTMQRFVLGGYLLQTRERVSLNTSKEDICNVKGEVVKMAMSHTWKA